MTIDETSNQSASSNAGVKHNIHVLPSWMMAKAMWHMDVPSLLLRRRYCAECRITFDVAAPWGSKGLLACNAPWVSSPPRQII
jgi:hypothetical protein